MHESYMRMALEETDPTWLEDKYDGLNRELDLDNVGNQYPRTVEPIIVKKCF